MKVNINAVKFRPADKLEEFINEKVSKLEKYIPECLSAEVNLKVDKPSSEMNKITDITLVIRGNDIFASKKADTFEEGVMSCVDALKVQCEKLKEKK
jgi:Ribosome-associated protein Y (PSrp-1)